MSDILKQVQELQEQFNNLFEVDGDGLGQPAVDVPPSQNKIKRDRKTKDGKVELVSVEDELFPYDGNKREQYRQKIIATINDMIQGKATLEDLLQIVRQKKAPLKEAIEILEEEIKKERKNNKQQVYRRLDDPEKNKINVKKYYNRVIHNDSESGDNANDYVKIKGTKYSVDKYGQIGAPLKEAMELMEEVLDKRTKNEKGMEATRKRSDHGASYRDYINHKELYPHNQGITGDEEKDLKREAKGLYKAIDHYNTWNKEHGYNPNPGAYINQLKSDFAKVKSTLKHINDYKRYSKHEALEEALSLMEEVINELSPATVGSTLDKRTEQSIEADDKDREEFGKILNMKDKDERIKAYKDFKKRTDDRFNKENKKLDVYVKWAKKHPSEFKEMVGEAFEILEKTEKYTDEEGNTHELEFSCSKDNKENKYKFDHRINGKSVVSAHDSIPNDNYERKHAIKNYGLKKVEEALQIVEAIINEVSVGALARATENNAPKRKEAAKKSEEQAHKAWDSYDKLSQEHPEDEPALYNAAIKLGKAAYKDEQRKEHVEDLEKLNLPKDSKVSANKLFKAADKSYDKRADEYDKLLDSEHPGKSYKETKESRPAKRYTRVARIGFAEPVKSRAHEALEEALKILEGMFVNDGRGDLLDDITGTKMTGIERMRKGLEKFVGAKKKNNNLVQK